MGDITYSDAIAIAQMVYYVFALVASTFICIRHGFSRASGWFFLITFCLSRIVGASGQLATINTTGWSTAATVALVCSVMGTSPLLLATLGLLSRLFYSILSKAWSIFFQSYVLRIIQLAALVALILSIVGATSVSNPAEIESNTLVHAAIILFLFIYIIIVILSIITICYRKSVPKQEHVLIGAVGLALPFLFVHIVYSMLAAFSHDSEFSLFTGSMTIKLCMSVIEEMIIVLFFVYAGFKVNIVSPPEDASPARTRGHRAGRGDFGGRRIGLLSLGIGAVRAFGNQEDKNQSTNQRRNGGERPYISV